MGKLRVGIIGCGTIGSEMARACQTRLKDSIDLAGICDLLEEKAELLQKSLKGNTPILGLDDLVKRSDLIVEAAGAKVSAYILKKAIDSKKDVLIMSIGGLLGNEGLLENAKGARIRVYLPSGALCGIDGLKSASIGRIDSVILTTRKPPKGLTGAPYITKNNIDLSSIKGETIIFEGTALDAVKGFPQNVNVAAILSLAGLGAANTRVRIVTSPDYTKNVHEVEIKGESGNITTKTENLPSKVNPKTSQLAVFSAIATLEGVIKSVRMGT
ncbi:MAG: aspartate dehydrogenase [Candidatus Omnitrophota bacterium]|nr:aspartate dehydrogenase [Candidatus Omnitrophota bacterium]